MLATQLQSRLLIQPRYHGTKRPRTSYRVSRFCAVCGAASSLSRIGGWDWLGNFLIALARKRFHKHNEGSCMNEARDYATILAKLPHRIAAVLAKSVAVKGDAFELDDAEALVMILDIINELDPTLIERNANKRLARSKRPS
jgi:hypothetical protein